jgi:hypothetical protein
MSKAPLDLGGEIGIRERARAYVEGGYIPAGMAFRVDEIEYTARVYGDSNGDGEFLLFVGPFRVAHVDEDRERFWLRTIDEGSAPVTKTDMPVVRRHSVKIFVRAGHESEVYAEIANSSACDVTLRGAFVTDADVPADDASRLEPGLWRTVRFLADSLQEKAEWRDQNLEGLSRMGDRLIPYFEALLAQGAKGGYRATLEEALTRLREK